MYIINKSKVNSKLNALSSEAMAACNTSYGLQGFWLVYYL